LSVAIVSAVCFVREALVKALECDPSISVVAAGGGFGEVVAQSPLPHLDALLVDAALPDGPAAVRRIRDLRPDLQIIICGLRETTENIVAWAESGAVGYIPDTAHLADLAPITVAIHRGRQPCPEQVVSGLLRRLAASTSFSASGAIPTIALTRRERQVAELVIAGHSDKQIARQMNVSLWTVKSHVHSLLGKLGIRRRGEIASRLHAHGGHSP
jgi:DNA-binding NarL/FixJ family response regulator